MLHSLMEPCKKTYSIGITPKKCKRNFNRWCPDIIVTSRRTSQTKSSRMLQGLMHGTSSCPTGDTVSRRSAIYPNQYQNSGVSRQMNGLQRTNSLNRLTLRILNWWEDWTGSSIPSFNTVQWSGPGLDKIASLWELKLIAFQNRSAPLIIRCPTILNSRLLVPFQAQKTNPVLKGE